MTLKTLPTEIQNVIESMLFQSIPFIIVEIRGANPDSMEYTSKKDGQKAEFHWMSLACEGVGSDSKQYPVSVDLEKGQKVIKLGEGRDAPRQ